MQKMITCVAAQTSLMLANAILCRLGCLTVNFKFKLVWVSGELLLAFFTLIFSSLRVSVTHKLKSN